VTEETVEVPDRSSKPNTSSQRRSRSKAYQKSVEPQAAFRREMQRKQFLEMKRKQHLQIENQGAIITIDGSNDHINKVD